MYAKKDASFMMPAADGTYRIRVDFNTNKITILGNYPKQVYLIGSNGEFKPNEASETIAMSETEGVYKATVNFKNLYFSVLTQLGTTEDDWTGIEPYRYGGGAAKINRTNELNRTDEAFCITETGSYDVTIDLRNMTSCSTAQHTFPSIPMLFICTVSTEISQPTRAKPLNGVRWKVFTPAG